jgi:hypothetical protein
VSDDRVIVFDVAARERLRAARAIKHPPPPSPGKKLAPATVIRLPEPTEDDLRLRDWMERRKRLRRVIVTYRSAADKRRVAASLKDRAVYADGFVLTWDEALELTHDEGVTLVQIRAPGLP